MGDNEAAMQDRAVVAERWPSVWLGGAVAVSTFLILATGVSALEAISGPLDSLLEKLALTGENNPAAWWSGMLLALASLHAYDGYVLLRDREPRPAAAWILLAVVLLILSADEVGSIHERVRLWGRAVGIGSWLPLVPFAIVLAAMLAGALALLWSAGGAHRRKVWLIATGVLLLSSVALQEFLEDRIEWQPGVAQAVRAMVEEGTELAGMLLLIGAAMSNTAGLAAGNRPVFAALHELRRPLATVGLLLAPVLAVLSASLVDYRGQPADWLAAVAFLFAGLLAGRRFLTNGRVGWRTYAAAGLCVLASVGAVEVSALTLVEAGPLELSARILGLGTLSLLVCLTWLSSSGGRGVAWLAAAIVILLVALSVPWSSSPVVVYALPPLLGLSVYWVNASVAGPD